jgi:small subunit ribosomal protein S4e
MAHLKRHASPKSWPIRRKGTKYVVRASSKGVPLLIVMRDMLKLAANRSEVKRLIHDNNLLLNEKIATDEKNNASLFDTITVIPLKKHYRVELSEKGKFELKEIKENETGEKIAKVSDKKKLKGGKIQLNLSDGRNFLSDIKCNTNDSVVINLKHKKIEKCLPLKEKARAFVFEGKHIGKQGTIEKIITEQKMAELENHGEKFNVLIKQLMVVQ